MDKGKYTVVMSLFFLLFFLSNFLQAFGYEDIDDTCALAIHDIQGSCYLADDFGFSTGALEVDAKDTKWVSFEPTLYTKGNKSLEDKANNIALTIEGGWRPWGNFNMVGYCIFNNCNEGIEQGCYPDGQEVDIGKKQKNIPCCVNNGYGLYGLIALDVPGGPRDPNGTGSVLDTEYFVTFRVAPLQVRKFKQDASEDQKSKEVTIKTFVLEHIDIWDVMSQRFTKRPIPQGGKLYFKVVDSCYKDNQGGYRIILTNGGYAKKKGFIENLMDFFMSTFHEVTDTIYDNLVKESGFRTTVKVILTLFMTFTIIFFMIGLIEINQTELVVRLFKIGVIATLISDTTLNTIPNLFESFIEGSLNISNIIMKESMYDPKTGRELLPFPELDTVFSAYDGVIDMVTSKSFNVKIWGLLFTSKFYLIIGIYVCVVIMFIGMWRSLVQYIMSLFLLALLIVVLPIFLVTILFKATMHLFDNWLEQFINSCLMIIVVTTTVALMLSLIITQLQDLLHYTVCWESIWKWRILGITIIDFKFWKPDDWTQFSGAVTALRFFYVLISCVLFRVYMDYVPELVDALGGVARRPLSGMYMGGGSSPGIMKSFENFMRDEIYGSKVYQALDERVLSPMKQRLSLLYYVDKGLSKIPKLGMKKGAMLKGISKAYEGTSQAGSKLWDSFVSNPGGGLGVMDLGKEMQMGDKDWKEFEKRYGKYGYKIIGKGIAGTGRAIAKTGKLARKGIDKFREWRKPMDQKDRELMQKMLAEDKVVLDKRVRDTNERYEQLKNAKEKILSPERTPEDLAQYKEALQAFEGDRELVKQELKLYTEQEKVLSGEIGEYELQENLNQVRSRMDEKVSLLEEKQERFLHDQGLIGEQIQGLDRRDEELTLRDQVLKQERQGLVEFKQKTDAEVKELWDQNPLDNKVQELERRYIAKKQKLESKEGELRRDFYSLEEDSDNIIKKYKPAHDQFTEDIAKAREEIDNLQITCDEQRAELDNYNKELEDMWSTQDFAIEIPEHQMSQNREQSGIIEENAGYEMIQPEQDARAGQYKAEQAEIGSEIVQGKVQEKVERKQTISAKMVQIEETAQKSEDKIRHLEEFQQKLKEKLQEEVRKIK